MVLEKSQHIMLGHRLHIRIDARRGREKVPGHRDQRPPRPLRAEKGNFVFIFLVSLVKSSLLFRSQIFDFVSSVKITLLYFLAIKLRIQFSFITMMIYIENGIHEIFLNFSLVEVFSPKIFH